MWLEPVDDDMDLRSPDAATVRRVRRILGLGSRPLLPSEIEAATALPGRAVSDALIALLVRGQAVRIGDSWILRGDGDWR